MKRNDIKQMLRIAVFSAFIAVSSWIAIPAAVPFTLQTFAVLFALMTLGGAAGTAAVLIYVALGVIGIPVFAGFGSGIGAILGAGGGFIIAFPISGLLYTLLEVIFGKGRRRKLIYSALALAATYVCGSLWFSLVYADGVGFFEALSVTVIPFIVPDMIKAALAFYASERVGAIINNEHREGKRNGKRKDRQNK